MIGYKNKIINQIMRQAGQSYVVRHSLKVWGDSRHESSTVTSAIEYRSKIDLCHIYQSFPRASSNSTTTTIFIVGEHNTEPRYFILI